MCSEFDVEYGNSVEEMSVGIDFGVNLIHNKPASANIHDIEQGILVFFDQ